MGIFYNPPQPQPQARGNLSPALEPTDNPPFEHELRGMGAFYGVISRWYSDPDPIQRKIYYPTGVVVVPDNPPWASILKGKALSNVIRQWFPDPDPSQRWRVVVQPRTDAPPIQASARTRSALGNVMDAWARDAVPAARQRIISSTGGTVSVAVKVYLLMDLGGGVSYLQRVGYAGEVVYIEKM